MRASASGHKVSHAVAFVTFVVMNMTGEYYDARPNLLLLLFKKLRQLLLGRPGRTAAATVGLVACARQRRVVQSNEHERNRRLKSRKLLLQPLALRPGCLVLRTIQSQEINYHYLLVEVDGGSVKVTMNRIDLAGGLKKWTRPDSLIVNSN